MTSQKTRNERDIILSDPVLASVLSIEANSVGVSLEEYVDRFLEVFYKEPQKFYTILNKQISV